MRNRLLYNIVIWGLTIIAVIYACLQIYPVLKGAKQPAFKTYYYAVKSQQKGLDPYNIQSLQHVSGDLKMHRPFIYPPHALTILKLFTLPNYTLSYYLFLIAKIGVLACLIMVWVRIIPISRDDYWALAVIQLHWGIGALFFAI